MTLCVVVVFLHGMSDLCALSSFIQYGPAGGPGGGIVPEDRSFFNPAKYKVISSISFQEPGLITSRSSYSIKEVPESPLRSFSGFPSLPAPHTVGSLACLEENTTWDLIKDIEKLRLKLGIEKWNVFGGSWVRIHPLPIAWWSNLRELRGQHYPWRMLRVIQIESNPSS